MLFASLATAAAGTAMQSFIAGAMASVTIYSICKTGKASKKIG